MHNNRDLGEDLPIGVGIGYRKQLTSDIQSMRPVLDCVEVIVEQFTISDRSMSELAELSSSIRVIPHGISLSIGSFERIDRKLLKKLTQVCDMVNAPFYSDHLCQCASPGVSIGHLTPIVFNREQLRKIVDRVEEVQQAIGRQLVLENTTNYFELEGSTMSQQEFFCELISSSGCGVLLDVTNVVINSRNLESDPWEFVDAIPRDAVKHIHLSGGTLALDGRWIDTHSERVDSDTWSLYDQVMQEFCPTVTIIEHDSNFLPVSQMTDQLRRAKAKYAEAVYAG